MQAPQTVDASSPLTPAPAAQPAAADVSAEDQAVNAARLGRGLRNAVTQQGGTVTLRMTPPELGTVRIQLQMEGGNVAARFQAETPATQNLLQQQLQSLRQTLEGQGLNVERLTVGALSPAGSSQAQGQPNTTQQDAQDQRRSGEEAQRQGGQGDDGRSRGNDRRDAERDARAPWRRAEPDTRNDAGALTAFARRLGDLLGG